VPDPPHVGGRGGVRRAGRDRLILRSADQLAAALLAPAEAEAIDVHGGRDAAVLVPLFEAAPGDLHAVFTRRHDELRRHAGEISFPGGRRDEGEALIDTALREAHEEIGLPRAEVRLLGALPPTPTFVTNFAIYPFVGLIRAGIEWALAHAEVAEVLELSLDDLHAGRGQRRLVRRGIPFRTPTYEAGGHVIWGATARILETLFERLDGATRTSRSAR
jgi:8-oxo-dGTP pyrophosphatase MutT (NUDIX family)